MWIIMSRNKEYKFLKPLSKAPDLPDKPMVLSEGKRACIEFLNSDLKFAEVTVSGYSNLAALSRSLGRILHGGDSALDPDRKITVRSDPIKEKVYLIRK